MKWTHFTAFLIALTLFSSCASSLQDGNSRKKPRNIIFLIGDGMGLSQVSAPYYFGEGTPHFSRFKNIGLINTSSASHKITDSAAGATAFASGVKTYNGAIGMNTSKSPVPTILEQLSEKGWNSGLISTSSITHATPASFYAHVEKRSMAEDIANQMVNSPVDFFAGGGTDFFCHRKDGKNLLDDLEKAGFVMDTNSLEGSVNNLDQKYGFLLAPNGMPSKPDGREDFLLDATNKALDYLSNQKDNFFLMIEGSQIDWGGHDNDAEYIIQEMNDFNEVIGRVLDFAERQGNTLVVVTADHETGGFTLSSEVIKEDPETGKKTTDYNSIVPTFSTGGHSSTLIPVFAWGPGSQHFRGIEQNTHLYTLFKELAGL